MLCRGFTSVRHKSFRPRYCPGGRRLIARASALEIVRCVLFPKAIALAASRFAVPMARAETVAQFTSLVARRQPRRSGNPMPRPGGTRSARRPTGRLLLQRLGWAEHVAGTFAAKGLATGNFAFGGARGRSATGRRTRSPISPTRSPFRPAPPPFISGPGWWFRCGSATTTDLQRHSRAMPVGRTPGGPRVGDGALALRVRGQDVAFSPCPISARTLLYASLAIRRPRTAGEQRQCCLQPDAGAPDRPAGKTGIERDHHRHRRAVPGAAGRSGEIRRANATVPCLAPGPPPVFGRTGDAPSFDRCIGTPIHGEIAAVAGGKIAPVPLPAPALLLLGARVGLGLRRPAPASPGATRIGPRPRRHAPALR